MVYYDFKDKDNQVINPVGMGQFISELHPEMYAAFSEGRDFVGALEMNNVGRVTVYIPYSAIGMFCRYGGIDPVTPEDTWCVEPLVGEPQEG